jgi:thioredoxin reductase (NADPH)
MLDGPMKLSLPSEEQQVYDVIIVGGGPAGATAALYAARAGLKTLVVDKGLTAGALGMATRIVNYPGVPDTISGAELVRRMRDQARSFGAEFVTDRVPRSDLKRDPKEIWGGQTVYRGRTVIVATGTMGRTNYLPGEEPLIGRGVSYCATCDGAFFRGHEIAVIGNNDEAVDEALTLTRFAQHVHFLCPSADLRASPELAEELATHSAVTLHLSTEVHDILGEQQVEGVRVRLEDGEHVLPVAGVFIYLQGNVPETDFLEDQLPTGERGCLPVDEDFQTAIPGVFAAGDVLCGHLRQVAVSTAEGLAAATAVDRTLRGRKKLRPDWH